jgi:hypothetical protein
MNYSPDDFMRLMEEAERQGGAHLNERCVPGKYKLPLPVAGKEKPQMREIFTTGCNSEALFVIPYDPARHVVIPSYNGKDDPAGDDKTMTVSVADNNATMNRGGGFTRVCAVDDDIGRWPRFQKAIKDE